MELIYSVLFVLVVVVGLVLLTAYICFRMAFYVKEKKIFGPEEYPVPPGKEYEPFRDKMIGWMKKTNAMPREEVYITAFDGVKLYAKYFEYSSNAPLEIMFHGYRGSAERDLCGGVQRCFELGRSVLLVDQRASGHSGGNVITFGVLEHRDCLSWLKYAVDRFGPERRIMLTGISMGATTVLLTAAYELPDNVVCILGDCGFTSARDIIKKVIRDMKLPAALLYPFVRLGARLFGRFDPDERTALDAVKKATKPIILIHGAADNFVPCHMSRQMYDACASTKHFVEVPEAGHGAAFLVGREQYFRELRAFSKKIGLE